MPDHADSLDDALNISLDRAGRVDLELIARLADTTVDEAEAGLGDRIIRDPDTGEVMPAEDYLTGDVGTKLDHVTAMAEHLRRRAAREAMTEFAASTYATSEDMPAIEQAREWIDTAGTDVWRSSRTRTPPNPTGSDAGHRTHQRRTARMDHGLEPQPGTRPHPRLAGGGGTARAPLTRHPRTIRHRRAETVARAGMAPIARHQHCGRLCWTWRDGDAPQHYAPILADRRMPVRDLALFVHKIAHTDRLETADKTAILSNLFESYSAHDKHGSTIWTDTTIGAMARRLMPGTDDPTRLAERLATDMSVSEWIWGIARELPTCARERHTTPTARRHAPSTRAPTTTRSSAHAARNSSDNGGSSRSTPRPRTPTRRTRNGSNTWPTCWNAYSPPRWRPNRSRRRWEPHGSPPRTSTTS